MIRYFRKVIKHIGIVITTLILFTIIAAVISFYFVESKYEAVASYYVYQTSDKNGAVYQDMIASEMLISDISNLIKSDIIISKTKEEIEELKNISTESISKRIETTILNNTRILEIKFVDNDKNNAVNFLVKLTKTIDEFSEMLYNKKCILVVGQPKVFNTPVTPIPKRDIILGSVSGILFGLFIVFIIDCVQEEIKREEKLNVQ